MRNLAIAAIPTMLVVVMMGLFLTHLPKEGGSNSLVRKEYEMYR